MRHFNADYQKRFFRDRVIDLIGDVRETSRDTVWNFRCHLCGDEKRRGYLIDDNGMYFYCQRCKGHQHFDQLVDAFGGDFLLKEYRSGMYNKQDRAPLIKAKPKTSGIDVLYHIKPVLALPEHHFVQSYLRGARGLAQVVKDVYWIPSYHRFFNQLKPYTAEFEHLSNIEYIKEPRVWFLYRTRTMSLKLFKGRRIGNKGKENRCICLSIDRGSQSMPFNHFGVDHSKRVVICEGEIDAMSVTNGVARGSCDLDKIDYYTDSVICWDNEWRTVPAVKQSMERALRARRNVVLWPDGCVYKDLNEMKQNERDCDEFVKENSHDYLSAKFKLSKMGFYM